MRHVQHYPPNRRNKGASMTRSLWRAIYGFVWVCPQPSTQTTADNPFLCFRIHFPNFPMKLTLQTYALMAASVHPERESPCPHPCWVIPHRGGQTLLIAQNWGLRMRQILAPDSMSPLLVLGKSLNLSLPQFHWINRNSIYSVRCHPSSGEIYFLTDILNFVYVSALIMQRPASGSVSLS